MYVVFLTKSTHYIIYVYKLVTLRGITPVAHIPLQFMAPSGGVPPWRDSHDMKGEDSS